jgi:hypothetical protein
LTVLRYHSVPMCKCFLAVAALVRRDPSGLPLSPGVRFTENTAEIKIGDGLWVSASEAPTTLRIYAVDPATSQAALYGVTRELDKPPIIATRLKVIHGQTICGRTGCRICQAQARVAGRRLGFRQNFA